MLISLFINAHFPLLSLSLYLSPSLAPRLSLSLPLLAVLTYVSRPSEGWRLSADAFF